MPLKNVFRGRRGAYTLSTESAIPQAIGRASLIFRARAEGGQSVCVKVYSDLETRPASIAGGGAEALARHLASNFDHELGAYAQLEHPNILPLVDFGRDEASGAVFLVLPWCDGGDLRALMSRRQFIPMSDALPILQTIARALDYAHSCGYVHGDIKPENVLFATDPTRPFLSDFGSARRAAFVERVNTDEGVLGQGPGTTAYLSPEQIVERPTTPASDIYAFGTVAYEMLTARLPVESRGSFNQMKAKTVGDLVDARAANPRLSQHVSAALMRALSLNPVDRPATATLLCQMLSGEVPVTTGTTRTPKTSGRLLTRGQRVALWTTLITVLGAISVAIVNQLPNLLVHTTTPSASASSSKPPPSKAK
jgi:serine/threonine protein kinase